MKVSLIINNYNYARYLPECIESALAQTYRDCEVLVVDDGSTDGSAAVIRSFGDRVTAVFKPNGGQASAYRMGVEQATGDLIQLLDADDYLAPDCLERVAAVWREGVVKVQFPLTIVNEESVPVAAQTPSGRLTDRQALEMMRLFGTYCSPPASGNVFSAAFLRRVLPFPNEAELKFNADAPPIMAAPYFGEIVSITEPLGFYRRHAAAHTSGTVEEFDGPRALARLAGERGRDELTSRSIALTLARLELPVPAGRLSEPSRAKRELCLLRLGAARRGRWWARWQACWGGIHGALRWDGYSLPQRLSACAWFLGAALLPYAAAEGFIKVALNIGSRPRWLSLLLGGRGGKGGAAAAGSSRINRTRCA
jgi:hypothetical protein